MDELITSLDNLNLYDPEHHEFEQYDPDKYQYIVSIDVGHTNLGISFCSITRDFKLREIIWFDKIDISQHVHLDEESKLNCKLGHTKTPTDFLLHIFYLHHELFLAASYILVERQPPTGMKDIEQLFYFNFRDKVILIAPNSVHCFMGWNNLNLDYEQRKIKSEELMYKYLKDSPRKYLIKKFNDFERKHDIADSFGFIIFWLSNQHQIYIQEQNTLELNKQILYFRSTNQLHWSDHIDQFAYKK